MSTEEIIKTAVAIVSFIATTYFAVRQGVKSAERRFLEKGSQFDAERELRKKLEKSVESLEKKLESVGKELETKQNTLETRYNNKIEVVQKSFVGLLEDVKSYQLATASNFVVRDDHKERVKELNGRISDLHKDIRSLMMKGGAS